MGVLGYISPRKDVVRDPIGAERPMEAHHKGDIIHECQLAPVTRVLQQPVVDREGTPVTHVRVRVLLTEYQVSHPCIVRRDARRLKVDDCGDLAHALVSQSASCLADAAAVIAAIASTIEGLDLYGVGNTIPQL